MRKFFCTCLLVFMKESVRAEQFLYVKDALQYVNGHAEGVAVVPYTLVIYALDPQQRHCRKKFTIKTIYPYTVI